MCPQGANVAGARPERAGSTRWTRGCGGGRVGTWVPGGPGPQLGFPIPGTSGVGRFRRQRHQHIATVAIPGPSEPAHAEPTLPLGRDRPRHLHGATGTAAGRSYGPAAQIPVPDRGIRAYRMSVRCEENSREGPGTGTPKNDAKSKTWA